jgi:hypothetical protein
MRKIMIVAAAAAAVIGVSACSNTDAAPAPTVTVTQQAPAPTQDDPEPPSTAMSNEELYLLGLRSMGNPIIDIASDSQLLDMGYSVCDALESGFTVDDVIAYMATEMAREGLTSDNQSEAVGYIIGAADTALCPSATF